MHDGAAGPRGGEGWGGAAGAGHTLSWGRGDPRLLTECHDAKGRATGGLGPLDPTRAHTYTVLWRLLREVSARFPDSFMHLGGDEVPLHCWKVRRGGRRAHMCTPPPHLAFLGHLPSGWLSAHSQVD